MNYLTFEPHPHASPRELLDGALGAWRVAQMWRNSSQVAEIKAGLEGNDRLRCLEDAVRYKRAEIMWLRRRRAFSNHLEEVLEA